MKIDRLLSIIIYLLNHELVQAADLAERMGVTARTIQRDMETIEQAGIPLYTVQGPRGGYGIVNSFKMDRQLMSLDDFYYIITALEGVGASLSDEKLEGTLAKMRTLLPGRELAFLTEKNEKLSLDFSALGGDIRQRQTFRIIREAVESERLLKFSYANNKLIVSERTIEPMTIAFRWRSWYLFGFCLLKQDYRLFRVSRIKEAEIVNRRFRRREQDFDTFLEKNPPKGTRPLLPLLLRFAPEMSPLVEEHFAEDKSKRETDGSLTVRTEMPDEGWLYGYILSFGTMVEVLEPPELRRKIKAMAGEIAEKY